LKEWKLGFSPARQINKSSKREDWVMSPARGLTAGDGGQAAGRWRRERWAVAGLELM